MVPLALVKNSILDYQVLEIHPEVVEEEGEEEVANAANQENLKGKEREEEGKEQRKNEEEDVKIQQMYVYEYI